MAATSDDRTEDDRTEDDRSAAATAVTAATPDAAVLDAVPAPSGFDAFFMANHSEMTRALALALGDVELGRDAAGEAFTRALQRWDRVERYDNPTGWVYRVGLNWGRSRWRKQRREVHSPFAGRAVEAATPASHDLDLVAALNRLSVDHRAVVVGRYYLDWTEARLAAALEIAPGTVKSRLSRALDALAETLEDPHG